MQKMLNAYFGIALALIVAFQAIALPHYSKRNPIQNVTDGADQKVSDTIISAHTSQFPIISEGERLTLPSSKNNYSFGDILDFPPTWHLIHFSNEIRKQVLLHQVVELFFGIRELKFPSHFFW
ncbi:MAG: hypothetical protein WD431_10375 [Cyclobacteriaceae bacterium]